MAKTFEDLRKELKAFMKPLVSIFPAEVVSVNLDEYSIDVKPIEGAEILDVRLKAGIDEVKEGMVEIPKVGSFVLIALIGNDKNTAVVLKTSEVEETLINGGEKGGIPINSIILENMNQIKDYLTALKAAVESGLTAVGVGAAANGPAGSAVFTNAMAGQDINYEDMEDTKIKH